MKLITAIAAAVLAAAPTAALAWGHSGHRYIGEIAIRALPKEIPAFLRTPQAAIDIGELSREPDRIKYVGGKVHDDERQPAHFVDYGDDGKIFGGPSLAELPANRAAYDTALRAVGQDSWKAGYLPYEIIVDYQALIADFAHWRVLDHAARNPAWRAHRAWFLQDLKRREMLIAVRIGLLSHFVGDGSQPLHVTVHFNGWGNFPNPNGYTTSRELHQWFEGDMIRGEVTEADVAAKIAPLNICNCTIEKRVSAYLVSTGQLVPALYDMEKAGGLKPGDRRGPAFAAERMAAGASELRDLIVQAWRASNSSDRTLGWRPVKVQDVLADKLDPYDVLHSID